MKKLLLIFACSLICGYNSKAQIQLVSTLAGQTTSGTANGTGTVASFSQPAGICADLSGNVYVADRNNHLIRKITPAGVVTTLAGSGSSGSVNATGTAASFSFPSDVCADASGNVYVCDKNNSKIRMITPAGVVSDFAGTGAPGSANGPALSATFVNPEGLGIDVSGNIYVADYSNQLIRKISGGVVTTVAGSGTVGAVNGTGTQSSFNYPVDVCVDLAGNLYVADVNNHCIRKIAAGGVVTTFAGTIGSSGYVDATGTAAKFSSPYGVSCDLSGNVYVADFSNHKVRQISTSGVVTTVAGIGTGYVDGNNTIALFSRPNSVAVYTGNVLYVADRDNNVIRKIESCTAPSAPANATSASTVCAGSTLTLSATSTGTVSWFNTATGGNAFATGTTFVTSNSQSVGNYTLYAESATSCTISATRTPVTYTVITCCTAPPAPVNTNTNGTTIGFNGYSTVLTASTTAGTISWYSAATGGTALATGTSYTTVILNANTTFYAEVTTCTVSATRTAFPIQVEIFEGLNDQLNALAKSIYPNPNNGVFTLELNNSDVKTISVIDITGRELLKNTTSDINVSYNLNRFANGVYYIKIQSAGKVEVLKVVKQ